MNRCRIVGAIVALTCVAAGQAVASTFTLVHENAEVRVHVPTSDALGTTWTGGGEPFDDSHWMAGVQAVGYSGPGDAFYFANTRLFLLAEMHSISPSAFIRIPFKLACTHTFSSLTLRARHDDGLVAYLNGQEIQRVGIPEGPPPSWSTRAADYPDHLAVQYANYDVSAHRAALRRGLNILAIHGLNNTPFSQDFFIQVAFEATVPDLLAGDMNGNGCVDRRDVALFARHFGRTAGAAAASGDFNGDGLSSLDDLLLLKANLPATAPGAAAVPEPEAWRLAMLGMIVGGMATSIRRRGLLSQRRR